MQIVVASKNPVKINAALAGFQKCFPDTDFETLGISADTGVANQPSSDEETRCGALNRAANARQSETDADFWVGIEGGIEVVHQRMYAFAWVVVQSHCQTGQSRSGTFLLPPKVQSLVQNGNELGDANDIVFAQHNSKQQGGAIGLLTGDVISRQQLYEHAVVLALVPFISAELFPSDSKSNATA